MRASGGFADTLDMSTNASLQEQCPCCRSDEVVSVRLSLAVGTPLEFEFCTQCEWRGWDAHGRDLPLSSVLGLAAHR
jgi:hypothetical protein